MRHHASNQRRAVCLILGPPPFIVHTPPEHLVSQHLSCLINTTKIQRFLRLPTSQSALLFLSAPFFLLCLSPFPFFPHSRMHLHQGTCNKAVPGFWRVRMKVRRQHNGNRDVEERRKEWGSGKEEWDRLFGLVDRLLLRSQRAPLLSADVDNGAAVVTEDEGGMSM